MHAFDLALAEGAPAHTSIRVEPAEAPFERFLELLKPASVALLIRFPGEQPPALRPATMAEEAVIPLLHEACAVSLVPLDQRSVALVITPESEDPFEPVFVHSLVGMLTRTFRLANSGPRADDPIVVPLGMISRASALQERLEGLDELLETLVQNRLRVQFQPIVDLDCVSVFGYEALIRVPQDGTLRKPGAMFKAADEASLVSWLTIACQERCFQEASQCAVRAQLFLNMDAEGLAYLHMAERSLADRAAEFGITPDRVVVEITERQAVRDYPRLLQYLHQLREEGFRLAIDDAGTGYNSLQSIAEIRPEYVKVERSLVRYVHENGPRRALLGAIARFAREIGTAVVAEGIETRDELAAVLDAGIAYGQGYLLARPNDGFRGLRKALANDVRELSARRARKLSGKATIGDVARAGMTFAPDVPTGQIARKFEKEGDLHSVVVSDAEGVRGLISRARLLEAVTARPGVLTDPAELHIDAHVLTAEASEAVAEVARRAALLPPQEFGCDILVLRDGQYHGVVPARVLLEALASH